MQQKSPLRLAREKRRLTLEQVADEVGSDEGNLSRIETGKQKPSPALAAKLAEYFAPEINELEILYPERFTLPKAA